MPAMPLTYLAQAAAAAFIAGLLILMLRRPAERWVWSTTRADASAMRRRSR